MMSDRMGAPRELDARRPRPSYEFMDGILVAASAYVRRGESSTSGTEKTANQGGDFIGGGVEREVAAIDNVDFGLRHIAAIGFGFRGVERGLILTPDHQQSRLLLSHPSLPFGVTLDVGAVVVEKVALDVGLAGLI